MITDFFVVYAAILMAEVTIFLIGLSWKKPFR
jgi:hypothetical protein